jgi:hypothetical protein
VAGDGLVVWDLTSPYRWGRILVHDDQAAVNQVAVRPDANGEVAVSASGTLTVFGPDGAARELSSSERTADIDLPSYGVEGTTLAAIGRGTEGWPDEVLVYGAAETSPSIRYAAQDEGTLTSLDLLDERNLVAGMNEGQVLVIRDGVDHIERIPTGRRVTAVAMAGNGEIVVGDEGGTLMCRGADASDGFGSVELGREINDLAISDDGTVAAATADGLLVAYREALAEGSTRGCDPVTWTRSSPPINHDSIGSLDLTEDGNLLVATTSAGTVEIWDLPRMRLVGTLSLASADRAERVSIHPKATRIVVGGEGSIVDFRVDREGLRQRLCEIAGRDLTDDEEETFLPDAPTAERVRCSG